jgi:hypothetical protein
MKQFTLSVFLLFNLFGVYGSHADSSFYDSVFERDLFSSLADSSEIEPIDFFLAPGFSEGDLAFKNKVNNFVVRYGIVKQPISKKQLKNICSDIQSEFLKSYSEKKYFADLFKTGQYNSVTASALYVIILDKLKIKFVIKETGGRVYVIADPKNNYLPLESSQVPLQSFQIQEAFKKSYVAHLHQSGQISENEFKYETHEVLFNRYYSSERSISAKELAALQYYNKAVFLSNEYHYDDALRNFEKAQILSSSYTITFALKNLLANILKEESKVKKIDPKILAKYMNIYQRDPDALQYGTGLFEFISRDRVLNNSDLSGYASFYSEFASTLSSNTSADEFSAIYFYYLGYFYYLKLNYNHALSNLGCIKNFTKVNPKIKDLIAELVEKSCIVDDEYGLKTDSLERYFKKFPFLPERANLSRFMMYCYSKEISHSSNRDDLSSAYAYLTRFEDFLKQHPTVKPDGGTMIPAYVLIGSNLVKIKKYDEAIAILSRGQRIFPESQELYNRIKTIKLANGLPANEISQRYNFKSQPDYFDAGNYIVNASFNRDSINQSVEKYLFQTWTLFEVRQKFTELAFEEFGNLKVHFLDTTFVVLIMDSKEIKMNLKYNAKTCEIEISNDKKDKICFMVTSIDSSKMVGLVYRPEKTNEAIELVFKSE